jgi:hypothetical protein
MATLIEGGQDFFDALAFGMPHQGTINFLNDHLATASTNLSQSAANYFATIGDAFARVDFNKTAHIVRMAHRKVKSIWQNDDIRPLYALAELQHAQPQMQRWIMAEPTTRSLFHKQQIDGYSDTYVDMQPGKVGVQHYDYRRAMNGLVVETESGGWTATTFMDQLLPNDRALTLGEQIDVQDTWNAMRERIKRKKEDPTSKYGQNM